MRTIKDVIRAVSGLVERTFGAPPTTKDIREGFDRPCAYVQPVLIQAEGGGPVLEDTFGLEIIYLAPRRESGYLQLLDYQGKLREVLSGPVPVSEGFFLYPEDVGFRLDREDMALVTGFTLHNVQLRPDPEDEGVEDMKELEINMKEER